MTEEESGAWGCVDNGDVIVRLTGQQTNHAASELFTLWVVSSSMRTLAGSDTSQIPSAVFFSYNNGVFTLYSVYFSVTVKI